MLKKIIVIVSLITIGILHADTDITEEEKVRLYQLSNEEAAMTPHQLFLRGKQIFYTEESKKTANIAGDIIDFSSSDNKNNAMRYLIPAAKSGHIEAGLIAFDYLKINGFYPNSRIERFEIAKMLDASDEVYGTYMLANCYKNGIGTGLNFDIAQELYSKVVSLCKRKKEETLKKLSFNGASGYDRCMLADANYKTLHNVVHERLPMINTDDIKKQESIRKLMQQMIDSKKAEAENRYEN